MVWATSSMSYVVQLPTLSAECQAEFSWTILARQIGPLDVEEGEQESDGLIGSRSAWSVLATASQGTNYEVERLNCPSGYEFRLQPEIQRPLSKAQSGQASACSARRYQQSRRQPSVLSCGFAALSGTTGCATSWRTSVCVSCASL